MSGWRVGKPRPNQREENSPEEDDQSLQQLRAALPGTDVLICDTFSSLIALANENDNHTITNLMQRINRVARAENCAVLLLHHTPKMTRDFAASQRGEATLVRGGSAITNSARIVLSLTSLPSKERLAFGATADRVRRLEHIKINDMVPMAPTYLELVSQRIKVYDGTEVPVRAVRFIASPTATATGITNAVRRIVMNAIDAGVTDDHGARVPLTRPLGGSSYRDAIAAMGKALAKAKLVPTGTEAQKLAREVLDDLIASGCVVESEDHSIPQYRKGRRNGEQLGRGLETQWHLASWNTAPITAPQAAPGAPLLHQPTAATGVHADAAASTTQMGAPPAGGVADTPTGAPATKSEQASAPLENSGAIAEMSDESNSTQLSSVPAEVCLSPGQPPVQAFTGLTGSGLTAPRQVPVNPVKVL